MKRTPVTTIDPIDIALAEAKDDDNSLSHRLLAHQIQLVAAQLTEIPIKNDLVAAQLYEVRIKRVLWGGAVAAMLGLMTIFAIAMVNASRSHALIVEPFHVPASLEARGLDGTTIANRLTDRFAVMRDLSGSSRAEDSYANGADGDIKIAIPNTGVSVGEVWRYLREWLGHDRRIGGDVTMVGDQLEITARIIGGKGESFRAPLADPTSAIDAAAASIFKQTQPYRYALMIGNTQGADKAIPLMRKIAEESGDVRERQWGYVGWASQLNIPGTYDESLLRAQHGSALDPSFGKIYQNQSSAYLAMGRTEAALKTNRRMLELLRTPEQSQLSINGLSHLQNGASMIVNESLRNDQDLLTITQREGTLPEYEGSSRAARWRSLVILARLGEVRRAAQILQLLPFDDPALRLNALAIATEFAMEVGQPKRAAGLMDQVVAQFATQLPKGMTLADASPTFAAGYTEILVAAGRVEGAATAIAPTRLDCYPCLVARGEVAAAQRGFPAAARWFAEAARQGPSLPQADYQWGQMLAANHDRPAALAHFAVAAKRAPGWYEPPYAAGRIFMAQNRFAEARAALEKAHAAAPRRADVMLALGRAQWLGGNRAGAKTTWDAARKLDLLEPEIAWLKVIEAAVKRAD